MGEDTNIHASGARHCASWSCAPCLTGCALLLVIACACSSGSPRSDRSGTPGGGSGTGAPTITAGSHAVTTAGSGASGGSGSGSPISTGVGDQHGPDGQGGDGVADGKGGPDSVDAGPQDPDSSLDTADASAPLSCEWSGTWTFGAFGGNAGGMITATLTPPGVLTITTEPPLRSCTPMLPACGSPDKIDISDIVADLADPDVQAALAALAPPTFGAVLPDRGAFRMRDAQSHGFTVEAGLCAGRALPCTDPPTGINRLVGDLAQLEQDGLDTVTCHLP